MESANNTTTAAAASTASEADLRSQLEALGSRKLRNIINRAVTAHNLPEDWRPARGLSSEELVDSVDFICNEAPSMVGKRLTVGDDLNIIAA